MRDEEPPAKVDAAMGCGAARCRSRHGLSAVVLMIVLRLPELPIFRMRLSRRGHRRRR